jgi:hypothetical protein
MPKAKEETSSNNAQRSLMVLIIQIVLLLLGILVYFYFTGQYYVVDCKKDEASMVNCTTRSTVLGVVTLQENTVTGMAAASVTDNCQGAACQYRLELYDNQGVAYPVEDGYTPGNVVKEKVAKLLNDFVVRPDKKEIKLHEGLDWLIFTLPVTAIIAFIIFRLSLVKPK